MALIKGKFIADDAISQSKIKSLNNEYTRGRNAGDSADIDMIKVNASDQIELASVPKVGGVDVALVSDIAAIPPVFDIQGNWNATTNSPALVSSTNGTGATNPLYIVTVAGTTSIDGEAVWSVGDWIYFANGVWNKADNVDDVVSVAGKIGVVTLDTDDVSEATNLYHTVARAKAAAVVNSTVGSETDQAASVAAMKTYVGTQVSSTTFGKEVITLVALDISNGYVDLAQAATANSMEVTPVGGLPQEEAADYTLTVPVAVTRVTFAGDLASVLASGDKLIITYAY